MFASLKPSEPNGSRPHSHAMLLSEAARLIAKSKRHAQEIRTFELSLKQTIEELKATVKLTHLLLKEIDRLLPRGDAPVGRPVDLTERELTVWRLIAEGHSNKQIAQILDIAIKTVAAHRANLMAKLGARDAVTLTRYAIRSGIARP